MKQPDYLPYPDQVTFAINKAMATQYRQWGALAASRQYADRALKAARRLVANRQPVSI